MDKNKLILAKEVCHLHELIQDAKDSFDITQSGHGAEVNLNLTAENDRVHIDETHVTNVIYNLIDNAVKYSKDAPVISIQTKSTQKGFLQLTITDNGIGVNKDDQKMIFDKFFRVNTGNVHDVKGYGLGLYYVKLIVEEHGGTISVNSELGKGTSFVLTFPLG
jgi:two-component system phosphate regulon sensor histidine kinase PhoR